MPRCKCAAQRRYGTTQARELFKNTWEKQPDLAPNVVEYTKFFDRVRRSSRLRRRHSITFLPQVALLVVTTLVTTSALAPRGLLLRHWIKVARHCRRLQNFMVVAAICAGLSQTPVYRLSRTWATLASNKAEHYNEYRPRPTARQSTRGVRFRRTGGCVGVPRMAPISERSLCVGPLPQAGVFIAG